MKQNVYPVDWNKVTKKQMDDLRNDKELQENYADYCRICRETLNCEPEDFTIWIRKEMNRLYLIAKYNVKD